MSTPTLRSRIIGSIIGTCISDALGVYAEFSTREARDADPIKEMRGHGTWNQPVGTWSDDSSMTLAAADVLVRKGWDLEAVMDSFVSWYDHATWTAHGVNFDCGNATRAAIAKRKAGFPASQCGGTSLSSNGNGSLMRCMPLNVYALFSNPHHIERFAREGSALTHAHDRSTYTCVTHARMLSPLANGRSIREALAMAVGGMLLGTEDKREFARLEDGSIFAAARRDIQSGGYCIHSLESAVWCLHQTETLGLVGTEAFAHSVLAAVNLGSDTDTTAAITGALSGWIHGAEALPLEWQRVIAREADVVKLAVDFADTCLMEG